MVNIASFDISDCFEYHLNDKVVYSKRILKRWPGQKEKKGGPDFEELIEISVNNVIEILMSPQTACMSIEQMHSYNLFGLVLLLVKWPTLTIFRRLLFYMRRVCKKIWRRSFQYFILVDFQILKCFR